jgi:CRP-like cAMP-binding protein
LGFIETGGIFGEMALIDQSRRMASAYAEETSSYIVIPEQTFTEKLRATDSSLRLIVLVLIRLLRHAADQASIPPMISMNCRISPIRHIR